MRASLTPSSAAISRCDFPLALIASDTSRATVVSANSSTNARRSMGSTFFFLNQYVGPRRHSRSRPLRRAVAQRKTIESSSSPNASPSSREGFNGDGVVMAADEENAFLMAFDLVNRWRRTLQPTKRRDIRVPIAVARPTNHSTLQLSSLFSGKPRKEVVDAAPTARFHLRRRRTSE